MKKYFFKGFCFKTHAFLGVNKFFLFLLLLQKQQTHKCCFCQYFLKCTKKVINSQKRPKWCLLWLKAFFQCVFKNTDQKDICVSIVLKAESKPKYKETFLLWVFHQKPKTRFFGGPKWQFLKLKFRICISAFVL